MSRWASPALLSHCSASGNARWRLCMRTEWRHPRMRRGIFSRSLLHSMPEDGDRLGRRSHFAYYLLDLAHDDARTSVVASEALAIGRQTGAVFPQMFAGAVLAMIAVRRNEVERVGDGVRGAPPREDSRRTDYAKPTCLGALAIAASCGGRYRRAARLLGAADGRSTKIHARSPQLVSTLVSRRRRR